MKPWGKREQNVEVLQWSLEENFGCPTQDPSWLHLAGLGQGGLGLVADEECFVVLNVLHD